MTQVYGDSRDDHRPVSADRGPRITLAGVNASDPPIDLDECGCVYEAVSDVHGVIRAHVPASLVRRFRKKLRRAGRGSDLGEVKTELIRFLCGGVASKQGFRIVTPPMYPPDSKEPRLSTDHDFRVELMVDTAVAIEAPSEFPVELLEPEGAIAEELVDAEMRRQCLQFGSRTPSSEVVRPSEVVFSIEVRLAEGERPILAGTSLMTVVEDGDDLHALGTSLPGVVAGMVGRKPGETTTVESVLPRNHPVAPLRGAPALVAVTIESVASIEPSTVEQVVAEYGASNETRLRTQIRFALEQQRSQSVRSSLREQLSRALPSMFQIGVPECRVRLLTARAETEFRELARLRGWSDDQTRAGWIERRDDSRRECERIARERVILQSLPGDGDVEASEEVINARIADLAARRGVRPEEARSSLVKSGRYEEFINEVLGEALLDAMVRRATVRPVPEAEWQAAMEAGWG